MPTTRVNLVARWEQERKNRALHEAAHAVVARKLGLAVAHVTIRKDALVMHESAAYLAQAADVATRIEALEKDAIVAQAGYTADVYEYPHPIEALDLFDVEDKDTDTINTRSLIYKMVCLQTERPFPNDESMATTIDRETMLAMHEVYLRVIDKAHALVDQNYRAIVRVAKHLERHGCVEDQTTLDSLIDRASRMVNPERGGATPLPLSDKPHSPPPSR
jgi:hypothetical protein